MVHLLHRLYGVDASGARDLRTGECFDVVIAGHDDLVEQTVIETNQHDDEMARRRAEQSLAVQSHVVETRLNQPVEQVDQQLTMIGRQVLRQLHSGMHTLASHSAQISFISLYYVQH